MPDITTDQPIEIRRAGATGSPVLVLHGGGGPGTVAPLVAHLAARHRVLAPTIPGWDGTPRPERIATIDDVARAFLDVLHEEDLSDVAVVGSSIGGWIASAMAVADAEHRVARVVLIDAVGVAVPGEPIRDFFALDARGVAEYSWHDGDRFFVDPASLPAAEVASRLANMGAMRVLAGDPYMHDPALAGRLGDVRVPVLGVWGASDRIVTPTYGRAFLDAFPEARFELVAEAGHLPHLEQPERTHALIDAFLDAPEA